MDEGEMLLDAIQREMIEETAITPVVGKLLYVHQFKYQGSYQGPEFFFNIENVEDYTKIDLSATTHGEEEIAEIGFFDPRDLDIVLPEFLKDIDSINPNGETKLIVRES